MMIFSAVAMDGTMAVQTETCLILEHLTFNRHQLQLRETELHQHEHTSGDVALWLLPAIVGIAAKNK